MYTIIIQKYLNESVFTGSVSKLFTKFIKNSKGAFNMLKKKLNIASGKHTPKLANEQSAETKGIDIRNNNGNNAFFIYF